jgi:hypothetical protein
MHYGFIFRALLVRVFALFRALYVLQLMCIFTSGKGEEVKTKTKNRSIPKRAGSFYGEIADPEQFLILKTIAVLLSSLLLSVSASLTGFTAVPLTTAFAAVLPPFLSAAALTGTIAGIIATGEVYIRLTDIISVIAVAAVKAAADKTLKTSFGAYGTALLAWVAYSVSGLSIAVATGFTLPFAASVIFRGILCGAAAYAAALSVIRIKKDGYINFSPENRLIYTAVLILIISAASGLTLFGGYISVGRVIGIVTILSAVYIYGIGGGAAAAAIVLFALMLSSNDLGRSAVLIGIAAVAAGLSDEMFFKNKFAAAVGFTVTALCAIIICGVPSGAIPLVCDIFAGAVIYSAVPDRFYIKIFGIGKARADISHSFSAAKSRFFSELLDETSQNFGKVSRLLNNQTENTKNNDSEKSDIISYEISVFRKLFEGFHSDISVIDTVLSKNIAAKLRSEGDFVCAGKARNGALVCEIIGGAAKDRDKLTETAKLLESLTMKEFEPPETSSASQLYRAVFCEKAPLCLKTGAFEMPLGAVMNGDTNVSFSDGFGNDYVLLSDGMGSGIRAAIESRMTVSLLQKFIRAGVSAETAAEFANFLLQAKSDEEMLSTVDLLVFSRFSGEAVLYKMGASKTFARVGGVIREFTGTSLPAGILRDPGTDVIRFKLGGGDTLIMLTDGVTEENFSKCREILSTKGINPKTAARRIVEESENEGRQDDKTAIFIEVGAIKSDF